MLNVYNNPTSPFVGPIDGGLNEGLQINISGTPGESTRFAINLQSGSREGSQIAFHFNPRFDENQVVRNTKTFGTWGPEERLGPFPFRKNYHFDLTIRVLPSVFRVSVDNQHYCDYRHRVPIRDVNYINIRGLNTHRVSVEKMSSDHAPVYNPSIPFVDKIGGLYPGRVIFIGGIPNVDAKRFTIDLKCDGETAFHFDVRVKYGDDKCVIVRNTHRGGGWGHEERHVPKFPFELDKFFNLNILVERDCFKVAVNNEHLVDYNHRVRPLTNIDTLRIYGDVRLCHVTHVTLPIA